MQDERVKLVVGHISRQGKGTDEQVRDREETETTTDSRRMIRVTAGTHSPLEKDG